MKRTLLGIGLVLIAAQLACGSESATYVAPPVEGQAGLSYDGDLQALLDANFEADGPSVVVLVDAPEGRFVAARGMADIYEATPADVGGRFRIGSVSKTFLAAALLDMVDDGLISLDDTLASRLPARITDNIRYSDRITVRQMLNMTSGIYNYSESDVFWKDAESDPLWYFWSVEDGLSYVYDADPYFAPGEGYEYSNSNYLLLQLMIEDITGQSLGQVIDERVVAPLGLQNTYNEAYRDPEAGIVRAYEEDFVLGWLDVTDANDTLGWGDGGMIATADDLAAFMRALISGRVLSPARQADMMTFVDDGDDGYGLGLMRYESAWGEVFGHSGLTSGFACQVWYLPDRDLAVVVLMASEDLSGYGEDIAEEAAYIILER
jgi:D-alanyl-D-alanine carboxypeptidase